MDELLSWGIPIAKAVLIVEKIRDCAANHQGLTIDGIDNDREICCNCGQFDEINRGRRYSCGICRQRYCSNCCSSIYYDNWKVNTCHNIYNFERCETCAIIVRTSKFDKATDNKTSKSCPTES